MILRRFTEALRPRDCLTVGIELLIVVVGVFLGIQVANWNEERTQKPQERSFLTQLRDEIASNDEGIEHQLRSLGQVIAGGR